MSTNGLGLASVATENEARKSDQLASEIASENNATNGNAQVINWRDHLAVHPIRSDLIGSNQASAAGLVATGHAPVTKLCRRLIEAGHDPALPLEVYRGTTLCLRVRSIGEGARLTVEDNENGRPRFVWHRPRTCGAAPPVAPNGRGL
jgi:hypothetical protein